MSPQLKLDPIYAQYNDNTKKLKINKRFIFGHQAYIVKAVKNWDNLQTLDNTSPPIIKLSVEKIAENLLTDDLVNDIADAFVSNYTIEINQADFSQSVGYSGTLTATVKLNGEIVSEPVTWVSSDVSVATIGATSGVVNLLASGSVNFTVSMTNNSSISDFITVNVSAPANVYTVVFNPIVTSIKQGATQAYNVVLKKDGVTQANTFTFAGSGAAIDTYALTVVDGNNFTIKSNKQTSTPLVITATSGIYNDTLSITLAGIW